ncbi:MAG TPA: hypothetical protein VHZ96_22390 [Frankiaceae bacterium]|jgi:hypothetical protein|nr:hypothetical protein [Frankiaceae bacterium]
MSTRIPAPGPQHAENAAFESVMGSRRGWRRLAKRAVAAHEREVTQLAREVAAAAPQVLSMTSHPLRGQAQAAVVTLTLTLPGWELQLSGVAAGAAADLSASPGHRRLSRTGRYGAFWWIEIEGTDVGGSLDVLLGSQLKLFPSGDGTGLRAPQQPELGLPVGR